MEHKFELHQPVLVRDNDHDIWTASFFSHYDESKILFPFVCVCGSYKQCIPAAGNAHLVGTRDNPEREFNLGDVVEVRNDNDQEWITAHFIYRDKDDQRGPQYLAFSEENKIAVYYNQCRHADW